MNKPLYLGNNFSCIMKFLCLVDRPFFVVSWPNKNKRWDFTEQFWLKSTVRAQGAFFKLCPKSHLFLPNKSDSHCPSGGFRFNPIWNLTFYYLLKKNKKRRLSWSSGNICTKRQPLQTALFLNAMLTFFYFFGRIWGPRLQTKLQEKLPTKGEIFDKLSESSSYRPAFCAN